MKLFLLFISLFTLLQHQHVDGQSESANKDVVLFYFDEVVNLKKLNQIDRVFADSFVRHDLTDNTQRTLTKEQQQKRLTSLLNAFPDLHYTIGDIIAEDDKVVVRAELTATHQGEFHGYPATGNRINYLSEIFFFRFENGKIVERWNQIDWYNLYPLLEYNN